MTVATLGVPLFQVTFLFVTLLGLKIVFNFHTSPSDKTLSLVSNVILSKATSLTFTVTIASFPLFDLTTISVFPFLIPFITPFWSTVAILLFLLAYVTFLTLASLGRTLTFNLSYFSLIFILIVLSFKLIAETDFITLKLTIAVLLLTSAVIVTFPFPLAVTNPFSLTTATFSLSLVHFIFFLVALLGLYISVNWIFSPTSIVSFTFPIEILLIGISFSTTFTTIVSFFPLEVLNVTTAFPTFNALTSPVLETLTTSLLTL